MAEREARVLGAGDEVEVDGKAYHLAPVQMRELQEIQREAVKFYKRQ